MNSENRTDGIVFEQDIPFEEDSGTIKDYCTSRGFPMGGIGTGGFSMFTDGGIGMFRTNHNWFKTIGKTRYPRGSFLAVFCRSDKERAARILRRDYRGGKEFGNIANIAHTSFRGRLPFFELAFRDEGIPVSVNLSGFTSLIPQNIKDSSLPAAFFRIAVSNTTDSPVDVSLLFSFENILGIGGSGGSAAAFPLDGPVTYNSTRKNYAQALSTGDLEGLVFKTGQRYGTADPRRRVTGEYLLFCDRASLEGAGTAFCTGWDSSEASPGLIDRFVENGTIEGYDGRKGNSAAYTAGFSMGPGESRFVNLYLVWWTPFHVIEKKQRLRKLTGRHRGTDYGHYFLNFFSTGLELAEYCVRERNRLERETAELPGIIEDASIPEWLKRYVLNSTDSVLINSILTRDGSLYIMEGVPWGWPFGALTGTIDQRMAAHPYTATFFTEIDRTELISFVNLSVEGRVPHGNGHADIALGSHDVPYGNPIKSFNRTEDWTDLPQSLIMQIGKMVLQTGDMNLLTLCWPAMVKMMEFLDGTLHENIPEGITTYDYMHYHPSFIYTAVLHCATLKMMIEMGKLLQNRATDDRENSLGELIDSYRKQYRATADSYEKFLWDERGFFRTCRGRDTIFTSALAGDWIGRFAGIGPAVEYEKALSHSGWQTRVLVDSYPVMKSRAGNTRPLIYREADPEGNEIPSVTRGFKLYRVNNPWQSIGYQGIEAIFLGRVEEGLRCIKRIWDKGWFEGYPWDMDHWGMRGRKYMTHPILWLWDRDHHACNGHVYMTHPVMWSVFTALTGVIYNAFSETITISPRSIPGQESFKVPVFFPDFWIMVEQNLDNKVIFTVLKTFGKEKFVKQILFQEPDGSNRPLPLAEPVGLVKGNRFTVAL